MSENLDARTFRMRSGTLVYDPVKSILLCRSGKDENRKLWARKINDINRISGIIEDDKKYYIACESGENNGRFIAVMKNSGRTAWFIPGKSFLQIIFGGFLYLIFIDETGDYYLIRVEREKGQSKWHHRVSPDLSEYRFSGRQIELIYSSGEREIISPSTGKGIINA
jgi:hypothetical protein